jgi:hypothetical protein
VVTRALRLVSSIGAESAVRHRSLSKIVITMQSLVILSLSIWIVQEYLNNMYLREYVDGVIQADGLIFGALGTLLLLGSISSMMFMRRKHGEKRFGAVSLDVKPPATPTIKTASKPSASPIDTSPKPSQPFTNPSLDFHPVVAALKADMADRRSSFGGMTGSAGDQPTAVPAPNLQVQKPSILDQLAPNRPSPMMAPRPGQSVTPSIQTPLRDLRPQPPTSPRTDQFAPFPQRPMLGVQPQQGPQAIQPVQPSPPHIPTNVTTVITGIMPVQKKKDPNAPSEEKPASQ